jgi:hypothetical protein
MTLEEKLSEVLGGLVNGNVSPDVVPDTDQVFPWITFQQVGGRAGWYMEREVPSRLHARVQVNVWAKTRMEAAEIARQVEVAICAGFDVAEPYGAPVASYEDKVRLYGTRQDFGIWYER